MFSCFFFNSVFICVFLYSASPSAGRTSLVERCTSCASSTSLPLSAMPFSITTPGSGFAWDQQSLSLLVIVVVWMEKSMRSISFLSRFHNNSSACLGKDWISCYILKIRGLSVWTIFPLSDRLVQEKYPSSLLARLSGKQHFLIPFNVLDLVYSQTVSWVGVYYCPLLPLIGTVTLIVTLYIKKVVWNMDHLSHMSSLTKSLSLFMSLHV